MAGVLVIGTVVAVLVRVPQAFSGFTENARLERLERKRLDRFSKRLREDRARLADARRPPINGEFLASARFDEKNTLEWIEFTNLRVKSHSRLKWEFFRSALLCGPVPAHQTPPESARPLMRVHASL
jgi:hypothetical protein